MERKSYKQLILEAKEKNSRRLILNNVDEKIDAIPKEIFELTQLEYLDIGDMPIRKIDESILKLDKLKEFHASETLLEKFPVFLMEHTSLSNLILSSKLWNELPESLNEWKKLRYLHIGKSTGIKTIKGLPRELGYLNISGLGMNNPPELLSELYHLVKLVIHGWGFKEIPKVIYNIKVAGFFVYWRK